MSLNDFYKNQANNDKAGEDAFNLSLHNYSVDMINEIICQIVKNAKKKPPKVFEMITMPDGTEHASWKIYEDHDSDYSINLLTDGKLCGVNRYLTVKKYKEPVVYKKARRFRDVVNNARPLALSLMNMSSELGFTYKKKWFHAIHSDGETIKRRYGRMK